ncbi:hypothetical protein G6F65_011089 [Rhizopus arrhizus]|nr:hypothetical protein G6F65_011089 [Rhizopus arrhizus]
MSSDSEEQASRILNTFMKGKESAYNNEEDENLLSTSDIEDIEQTVPEELEARLERMAKQNIKLVSSQMVTYRKSHEFKVKGSTGKTYSVTIGPKIYCDCRDHNVRGTHCKHILYILLKELKVSDLKSPVYETLTPSDKVLKDIFSTYHPRLSYVHKEAPFLTRIKNKTRGQEEAKKRFLDYEDGQDDQDYDELEGAQVVELDAQGKEIHKDVGEEEKEEEEEEKEEEQPAVDENGRLLFRKKKNKQSDSKRKLKEIIDEEIKKVDPKKKKSKKQKTTTSLLSFEQDE